MYNVYFVKIDCTLKSEGGGGKGAFYWQKTKTKNTFSAIFPERILCCSINLKNRILISNVYYFGIITAMVGIG